nr:reverse transcriptase domain-containing protein [Tanacetum cinerariifolium]
MGKKLLTSSKLAMRDVLGAIMVPISQRRRGREKSLREMRCLKTLSKFVRYSIYEVEAKALPTNDARVVVKFLKSLFSRFDEWSSRGFQSWIETNLREDGGEKPCLVAYENSVIYKERTKKLHDSKIKNRIFNVEDQVLLFNSRLKIFSRKLKTRWSGPFTITQVFPYGTIELSQPNGPNFKVNGHRVKHYFGGFNPIMIEVSRVRFDCPSSRASHPLFAISLGKSISLISIV